MTQAEGAVVLVVVAAPAAASPAGANYWSNVKEGGVRFAAAPPLFFPQPIPEAFEQIN